MSKQIVLLTNNPVDRKGGLTVKNVTNKYNEAADEKVWQAHSLSSTLSSKVSQPAFWNQLAEQVVLFEEALERAEALFEEIGQIEQIKQTSTPPISQLDRQLEASREQERL